MPLKNQTINTQARIRAASDCSGTTVGTFTTALSAIQSASPTSYLAPDTQTMSENDTIIAIMGPTGAGKSTFVKVATGTEDIVVGHGLGSCTMKVQAIRCRDPQRQRDVVFVDTPGFDDTNRRDTEILESIADWLKKTYRAGVKLSGVLYLHRITDNRIGNTILQNWDLFDKLCGGEALKNVIFVTTNWDLLEKPEDLEEGTEREDELRSSFWEPFLSGGAQMQRFEYNCASAWNIVNSLPAVRKPLKIQQEMVDEGKRLEDTAAGRTLFSWLQTAAQTLKELIRQLELILRKATTGTDKTQKKIVQNQLRDTITNLKQVDQQRSRLSRRRSGRSSESSSVTSNSSTSSWRVVVYRIYDRSERGIRSRIQRGSIRRHTSPARTINADTSDIGETASILSSAPPTVCDIETGPIVSLALPTICGVETGPILSPAPPAVCDVEIGPTPSSAPPTVCDVEIGPIPSSAPPTVCDIPDIDSFLDAVTGPDKNLHARTLTATIQSLRLARAASAGLPVPGLQSAVAVALRIAEWLNEVGDTDRSLVILMSNAGELIETICGQANAIKNPGPVATAVKDFHRELQKIQDIARRMKTRGRVHRYILQPDDKNVIIDCNRAMKLALHRLGICVGLATAAQNEDINTRLKNIETLVTRMVTCYVDKQRKSTWP